MDKGVQMMMRSKAEKLAKLDPILITFQIYIIKEGQLQGLMTLQMRRPTLVYLRIHMVDKDEENNGNQTSEETMNTN